MHETKFIIVLRTEWSIPSCIIYYFSINLLPHETIKINKFMMLFWLKYLCGVLSEPMEAKNPTRLSSVLAMKA